MENNQMLFSFLGLLFLQTENGTHTNAVTYKVYLVRSTINVSYYVKLIITHFSEGLLSQWTFDFFQL